MWGPDRDVLCLPACLPPNLLSHLWATLSLLIIPLDLTSQGFNDLPLPQPLAAAPQGKIALCKTAHLSKLLSYISSYRH